MVWRGCVGRGWVGGWGPWPLGPGQGLGFVDCEALCINFGSCWSYERVGELVDLLLESRNLMTRLPKKCFKQRHPKPLLHKTNICGARICDLDAHANDLGIQNLRCGCTYLRCWHPAP